MESYPLSYAETTVHLCLFEVSNAAELRSRLVTASQLPDDDRGDEERAAVDFAFIDAKMVRPTRPRPLALLCTRSESDLTSLSGVTDHFTATRPHRSAAGAPRAVRRHDQDQDDPLGSAVDARARIKCQYFEDNPRLALHLADPLLGILDQISDSLKHFGLSASTRHLLLVHIGSANGGDAAQERSAAEGVWRRMEAIVEGKAISLEQLGRLPDGGTDEKGIRKVSSPRPPYNTGLLRDLMSYHSRILAGTDLQAEPGRRLQELAARNTRGTRGARQADDKYRSAQGGNVNVECNNWYKSLPM